MGKKDSVEKTVRNIRRQARKKYSAEDKIRIILVHGMVFSLLGW
jgi:hypothetical protein